LASVAAIETIPSKGLSAACAVPIIKRSAATEAPIDQLLMVLSLFGARLFSTNAI
jgi:hypothetical protein